MYTLPITIQPSKKPRKYLVEIDADRLEKLASVFGFYNPDFLNSLERAEEDIRKGRVKKIKSLKELEK